METKKIIRLDVNNKSLYEYLKQEGKQLKIKIRLNTMLNSCPDDSD